MRRNDIRVGHEYLTRDVKVNGIFGPEFTRGHVRVIERAPNGDRFKVTWLMRDCSERKHPRALPKWLEPRRFMVELETNAC